MVKSCDRRVILQTLAAGFAAGAGLRSSVAGEPSSTAEVSTALTSIENAQLNREPFGDLRTYLTGQTEQLKSLTVGSLELKPGQMPHPPHTHPEEEVMVITEGHGEISLEGQVTQVGPGTVMYAGSNRKHGIVNTSQSRLTFYYFKWIGR